MKYKLILPLCLLFFLGCTENKNKIEESISLNSGAKWEVNEDMKPHIMLEQEIFSTYLATEDSDYKKLATSLKTANGKLIQSCTMKGKSHEELHKWLHPHMELLNELEEAESPQQASVLIDKLSDSFKLYHRYFE